MVSCIAFIRVRKLEFSLANMVPKLVVPASPASLEAVDPSLFASSTSCSLEYSDWPEFKESRSSVATIFRSILKALPFLLDDLLPDPDWVLVWEPDWGLDGIGESSLLSWDKSRAPEEESATGILEVCDGF